MAAENPACPNCAEWPDAREGLSKYDGYCATCFKYCHPRDPRSLQIEPASREQRVRDEIVLTFPHIDFIFNKPIHTKGTGCDCPSRRRIDNYVHLGGTILAIEVDENAHRHYNQEDEKNRYDELLTDCGTNMVYIRFNPDPTPTDRSVLEDRLKPLMEEIQRQLDRIQRGENTEIVEIYYMYYPEKSTNQTCVPRGLSVCPQCAKEFVSKYTLDTHMKRVHQKCLESGEDIQLEQFRCRSERCPYLTKYRFELNKHISKCVYVAAEKDIQQAVTEAVAQQLAIHKEEVQRLKEQTMQEVLKMKDQIFRETTKHHEEVQELKFQMIQDTVKHNEETQELKDRYRNDIMEKDLEIRGLMSKLEVMASRLQHADQLVNRIADRSTI